MTLTSNAPRDYIFSMNPPADCTPEEAQRAITHLSTLPLKELLRRQHINAVATIATCDSTVLVGDRKMEALRQLRAASDHLRSAIDKKESSVKA